METHGVEAPWEGVGRQALDFKDARRAGMICMADPAGMPWRRMAWKRRRAWDGAGPNTMDFKDAMEQG